jgi:hypothetical protein
MLALTAAAAIGLLGKVQGTQVGMVVTAPLDP